MGNIVETLVTPIIAKGNVPDGSARKQVEAFGDSTIKARDKQGKFVAGQKKAVDSGQQFEASIRRQTRGLVAMAGTYVSVRAAVEGVGDSITVFREFELRTAGVNAVLGATADEMARLEEQTKSLGSTTIHTARQAATAQEDLARAGFNVQENLDTLPHVLDVAAAAEIGLSEAAKITIGVLKGFRKPTAEAQAVVDLLVKSTSDAAETIPEMGDALKFAAPTAAGLKISLEDTSAALGVLADNMLKGSLGGTGFRQAMLGIIDPSGKAESVLDDLGISADTFRSTLEEKGLIEALRLLTTGSTDVGDAIALAGARGGSALQILLTNLDELGSKRSNLDDVTNAAGDMAAIKLDTLSGDTDLLASAIEGLQLTFGEALAPALREAQVELTAFFQDGGNSAKEWGEDVGVIIKGAADLFIFGAENAGVLKASLVAVATVKLVTFFEGAAVSAGRLILKVQEAVVANRALAASNAAVAGSARASSTSTAALAAVGLTPLAVGLGAAATATWILNDAIVDWSRTMQREIDAVVASTDKFFDSMKGIDQATREVIQGGDFEGMTAKFDELTISQEALRAKTVEAQEAMHSQAQLIADLEAKQNRQAMASADGGGTGALRETIKELQDAKEAETAMTLAFNQANIELKTTEASWKAVKAAVEGWTPEVEEADEAQKRLSGSIRKQRKQMDELLDSLERETKALDDMAKATAGGDAAMRKAAASAEVEKRFRKETANLTKASEDQLKKLRKQILLNIKAEKNLAGAKTIAALEHQVDALNAIGDAYGVSASEAEATKQALEIEAKVREATAEATDEQRMSIERLVKAEHERGVSNESASVIAAIRDEAEELEGLAKAYELGTDEGRKFEEGLKAQKELERSLDPLLSQHSRLLKDLGDKSKLLSAIDSGRVTRSQEFTDSLRTEVHVIGEQLKLNEEQRRELEETLRLREQNRQASAGEQSLAGMRANVEMLRLEKSILDEVSQGNMTLAEATRAASLELEIQRRVMDAGAAAGSDMASEIRKLTTEEFALEGAISSTVAFGDTWRQVGSDIVGILGQIDGDLGGLASQIFGTADAFSNLSKARAAGGGGAFSAEGRAAGAQLGGLIGAGAQAAGFTGGGVSGFGGKNAGNLMAEGAEIGGKFGGVWGAVLGAFVGAMVSTGADDLFAHLEETRGKADLVVTMAEGGLAEIAGQIENAIETFANNLQEMTTVDLDFEGAIDEIHIREDLITVVADGVSVVFRSMEEALAFAAQGILAANADAEGLGKNMKLLFEKVSGPVLRGGMEDINEALNLAQLLDTRESGITGELIKRRQELMDLGRRYGLDLEDIIALEEDRIEANKRALEASIASVFGVTDVASKFLELTGAMSSFDAEVAAEMQARADRIVTIHEELEAYEGMAAAIEEAGEGANRLEDALSDVGFDDPLDRGGGDTSGGGTGIGGTGGVTGSTEDNDDIAGHTLGQRYTFATTVIKDGSQTLGDAVVEGGNEAADAMSGAGVAMAKGQSGFAKAMADGAADFVGTVNSIPDIDPPDPTPPGPGIAEGLKGVSDEDRLAILSVEEEMRALAEEAEALAASLENVPTGFGADDVASLWTTAAGEVGSSLIAMIQAVKGPAAQVESLQKIQNQNFLFTLAQQIQAGQNVLDTMVGVSAATRAMLQGIVNESTQMLEDLAAGDLAFPTAKGGSGGRKRARRELLADFEALGQAAQGVSPGITSLAEDLDALKEQIKEGARLGIDRDILGGVLGDFTTVATREILSGFQEALDAALGVGVFERDLMTLSSGFEEARGQIALLRDAALATGNSTADLDRAIVDLQSAEEAAIQSLGGDFLRSLEDLGVAVPTEVLEELARAEFELAKVRAISSALALAEAGAFEGLGITLGGVIDLINGATFAPDLGGGDGAEFASVADIFASLAGDEGIAGTIEALRTRFAEANEEAVRLGATQEEINALREMERGQIAALGDEIFEAFQVEVDASKGIGPFERNLINLQKKFKSGISDLRTLESAMADAGEDTRLLAGEIEDLEAAQVAATRQLGVDFVQSLEGLGAALPIDVVNELASAEFALAQAQAISSAMALAAAGAFDGLSFTLGDLIGWIQDIEFNPDLLTPDVPSVTTGGSSSSSSSYGFDSSAASSFLAELTEQIRIWTDTPLGPLAAAASDMKHRLEDLQAGMEDALGAELGSSGIFGEDMLQNFADSLFGDVDLEALTQEQLGQLQGFVQGLADGGNVFGEELLNLVAILEAGSGLGDAFQIAARTFIDDALEPFEKVPMSPLEEELLRLAAHFEDMRAAFEDIGATAEDFERLDAAMEGAFATARQEFLDALLGGVRDRLREAQLDAPGMLPEQRLENLTGAFEDAIAASLLDPTQENVDAANQLFDQLSAFGAQNFTGGNLQLFMADLNQQLGSLLGIDVEDVLSGEEVLLGSMDTTLISIDSTMNDVLDGIMMMDANQALDFSTFSSDPSLSTPETSLTSSEIERLMPLMHRVLENPPPSELEVERRRESSEEPLDTALVLNTLAIEDNTRALNSNTQASSDNASSIDQLATSVKELNFNLSSARN